MALSADMDSDSVYNSDDSDDSDMMWNGTHTSTHGDERHPTPPPSPSKLFAPDGARVGRSDHVTTSWVQSVMAVGGTVYIPSLFFGLADGAIISTVPLLARGMG